MTGRPRHPSKAIEAALCELEGLGWRVELAKGRSAHAWGFALCPANARCRGGLHCRMSVWSTPAAPENHARALVRSAWGCTAKEADDA